MTTEQPPQRRSIAPTATVLGGMSVSGYAVVFANAQWWVAALILVTGFLGGLVQTLIPQNSSDRVKFWSLLLSHDRFRQKHKIDQRPMQQVKEAISPPPLEAVPTPEVLAVNEVRVALGQLIKARRSARKLSVAEVAQHLGCSTAKVRRLEAGTTRPKEADIVELTHLLAVPSRARRDWMELTRSAQGRQDPPPRPSLRGVS